MPPAAPRLSVLTVFCVTLSLGAGCGGCAFGEHSERPPPALACALDDNDMSPDRIRYAPDEPLCIHLEMEPADYDTLRYEGRGLSEVLLNNCSTPFLSPYSWHSAAIAVGQQTLAEVGIRNKGFFGSLNAFKPSFKIDTDRVIDNQELGKTEHVTLNNNSNERSRVRTCLAFWMFAQAGLPASRCNLASVHMNGRPLGTYSHIEPLKKRFLRETFGNDDGDLYEGTLTDFQVSWLPRFEAKTDHTDPDFGPLVQLAGIFDIHDEVAFLEALNERIDVPHFIRALAMEIVLNQEDGYSGNRNNFYIYFDPDNGGRGVFLPWSLDETFRDRQFELGEGDDEQEEATGGEVWRYAPEGDPTPLDRFLRGHIAARLSASDTTREQIRAETVALLSDVWDETAILAQLDMLNAQVDRAEVVSRVTKESREDLRAWIRDRPARLLAQLDAGFPVSEVKRDSCTADSEDD